MKKGDVVLFIAAKPQPVPRGALRMYTVGFVVSVTATLCIVTDICGVQHAVYTRQLKVIHSDNAATHLAGASSLARQVSY